MKTVFRDYNKGERIEIVRRHYKNMREKQTVEFVKNMEDYWLKFDKARWTIREAFEKMNDYVDSSDPDTSFPNIVHAFQTAERMREDGKPDWYQLVGLIHDLGKIMFKFGKEENGQGENSQWALAGDTWVIGCKIPDDIVYPEYNELNEDFRNNLYNTSVGMYNEKCGLDSLKFSFGHDEYLYRLLKFNKCKIPEEGLQMIRLHSCYLLHEKKKSPYEHFLNDNDKEMLNIVREFNKYDLYTKNSKPPNISELWVYYEKIINKYCPGKLYF